MTTRAAARLAWGLWALSLALVVVGLVFLALNWSTHRARDFDAAVPDGFLAVASLAFSMVGALIASRRSENAIGWIFCGVGLTFAIGGFASEYTYYALLTEPGALLGGDVMAWLASWPQLAAAFLTATLLLLIFPNGRLLSPRWRPALGLAVVAVTTVAAGLALTPGPFEEPYEFVTNPFGVEAIGGSVLDQGGIGWPFVAASVLVSAASMILRFRRSRGQERQQLKWIASVAAFLALAWTSVTVAYDASDLALAIAGAFFAIGIIGIPIAAGIAILRYRLYDIDRIINRTLVYGLLTGTLGGGYFGGVVLLQLLFSPLTGGSGLAIALTTLLVAALFRPARSRIQDAVDRRFNRRKYDAAKTIEAFSARLRQQTDLDALTEELLAIVRETMEPAHVSLWLRRGEARR